MNKRLLDGMAYTPASNTDIRKLFARVRREQKAAAERAEKSKPVPIMKARAK